MRQRSQQACVHCRHHKRKCDGELPCSTCTRYKHSCRYQSSNRRRTSTYSAARSTALHANPTTEAPADQSTSVAQPLGFLEPTKSRYLTHDSSAVQARCVALELGFPDPPRLHAFGYHAGVRKEPGGQVTIRLSENLTWESARECIDIYTAVIHPIFGFLDIESLSHKAKLYWESTSQEASALEAVISGVVALASLFSNCLDEDRETKIVLHAKSIIEDPAVSRRLCQDLVAAWILRTIYIRATGRPHAAWLCSATTMHIVELTGLHQAAGSVSLAGEGAVSSSQTTVNMRERVTSVAKSLHIMIAYDYGKSITQLAHTVQSYAHTPSPGDFTPQLCELIQTIPITSMASDQFTKRAELCQAMENLVATAADHDFLILVKAELCFAIYRRLHLLDPGPHRAQYKLVLEVGAAALPAARRLAIQNHPWWNTVNAIFQFVCVILSINSSEALTQLEDAMETLEAVTQRLNTHLAREALHTARLLINALMEKKNQEVAILQRARGPAFQTSIAEADAEWTPTDPELAAMLELYPTSSFLDFDLAMNN